MVQKCTVSAGGLLLVLALGGCLRKWTGEDLSAAVRAGDVAGVKECLADGVDPNWQGKVWWRPLDSILDISESPNVAPNARVEIVTLLLKYGADPNKKSRGRVALPLHFAARYGPVAAAERLIAAGADVNAPDDYEITPLAYAVMASQTAIVKVLLEHGADVNARQARVWRRATVLHLAAQGQPDDGAKVGTVSTGDQVAIIKLLLAKGADPSITDADGKTALDVAEINRQKEAAALLREVGHPAVTH